VKALELKSSEDSTIISHRLQTICTRQWCWSYQDLLCCGLTICGRKQSRLSNNVSPVARVPECTNMGMACLPCHHKLIDILKSDGCSKLRPPDFSPHWFIRRNRIASSSARVLEPVPIHKKTTKAKKTDHRGGAGEHGTRRDPTYTERVDMNHPAAGPTAREAQQPILPSMSAMLVSYNFAATDQSQTPRFEEVTLPP
jgi:hypothetical protein